MRLVERVERQQRGTEVAGAPPRRTCTTQQCPSVEPRKQSDTDGAKESNRLSRSFTSRAISRDGLHTASVCRASRTAQGSCHAYSHVRSPKSLFVFTTHAPLNSNANLERSIKATSSQATAPPGVTVQEGALVKEQKLALEKVAVWEDLLAERRVEPAAVGSDEDMEY